MNRAQIILAAMLMGTVAIAPVAAQAPAKAAPGAASTAAPTAAPTAAHIAAVQAMLVAMQAEKLMRMTAGASRYANEAQRNAVFAKLDKVAPAEIARRLAAPIANYISAETATELTRFYATSYGKKLLHATYNSGPSMFGQQDPVAVGPEKAELKRPATIKARQALAAADAALSHERFKLLSAINAGK